MMPIKQKHLYGCGAACAAFVASTLYEDVINALDNGKYKATNKGFFCKELTDFLNSRGFNYEWRYIKPKIRKKIYSQKTIVFIKKSKKYLAGHYLVRHKDMWMDSWMNFPNMDIKAGFRKRLPGKPIYAILPES